MSALVDRWVRAERTPSDKTAIMLGQFVISTHRRNFTGDSNAQFDLRKVREVLEQFRQAVIYEESCRRAIDDAAEGRE